MPAPTHRICIAVAASALIVVAAACSNGGLRETTTFAPTATSAPPTSRPPDTTTSTPSSTGAITSTTRPPASLPPPPTSTIGTDDDRIADPGNDAAAAALHAEPLCLTAVPAAILSWSISERVRDGVQRIDVTTARNGFDLRVFASGVVEPGRSSVLWDEAASGVVHFWRVLTLVDGVWYPSDVATFNGPFCIADQAGNG